MVEGWSSKPSKEERCTKEEILAEKGTKLEARVFLPPFVTFHCERGKGVNRSRLD